MALDGLIWPIVAEPHRPIVSSNVNCFAAKLLFVDSAASSRSWNNHQLPRCIYTHYLRAAHWFHVCPCPLNKYISAAWNCCIGKRCLGICNRRDGRDATGTRLFKYFHRVRGKIMYDEFSLLWTNTDCVILFAPKYSLLFYDILRIIKVFKILTIKVIFKYFYFHFFLQNKNTQN